MSDVAALFVATGGAYFGIEGVDPWDEQRDARLYAGPHPVVAHPPCARWGAFWFGGLRAKVRKVKGDDGGCFSAALSAVRRYGGVLEHPRGSAAWDAFGIRKPTPTGGWVPADYFGGATCMVEQGHYGHRARKATWLYACGVAFLPELTWGPSAAAVPVSEFRSKRARTRGVVERMGHRERLATPPAFRDLLISIARSRHE